MVPELIVDDLAASILFYTLLGFRVVYTRPAERFAYLTRGHGIDPMLEQVDDHDGPDPALGHPYGRGMNLSIDVEDATALHCAVEAAGHEVRHPIRERWFARTDDEVGVREFTVVDPDGYVLRPTEPIGTRPLVEAEAQRFDGAQPIEDGFRVVENLPAHPR